MKNIPKKIYLQWADKYRKVNDWNDLCTEQITWNSEKINDSDIEFVLSKESEKDDYYICACGAEIPEEDPYDGYCLDCG